jgi:lysophospholipase L1-like esterase
VGFRPGVTDVIVVEGINDIGFYSASAEQIEQALASIAAQAHAIGASATAGTLLPFTGAGYWTPQGEATRQAVNDWIRTTPAFDHVVDFDRATRDPADPTRLNPAYDSGDHLHPNDAGHQRMGEAVDLATLRGTSGRVAEAARR